VNKKMLFSAVSVAMCALLAQSAVEVPSRRGTSARRTTSTSRTSVLWANGLPPGRLRMSMGTEKRLAMDLQ